MSNDIYERLPPSMGSAKWGDRPPDVDCLKCWPSPGYGYRPTRRGKVRTEDPSVAPMLKDVKGVCFYCAGTGLVPIPRAEVMRVAWDEESAAYWAYPK